MIDLHKVSLHIQSFDLKASVIASHFAERSVPPPTARVYHAVAIKMHSFFDKLGVFNESRRSSTL
jgi:hypothetical protein